MDEIDRAQELEEVNPLQGLLRCGVCRRTEPIGDPHRTSWPTCCEGLTMLWVVGREERVG